MSTTIVPKDEQDASVLADVLPPPCAFMSQCRSPMGWSATWSRSRRERWSGERRAQTQAN